MGLDRGRGRWLKHSREGRRESGSELASAQRTRLIVRGAGGRQGHERGQRG
jgi:hypothetical protein